MRSENARLAGNVFKPHLRGRGPPYACDNEPTRQRFRGPYPIRLDHPLACARLACTSSDAAHGSATISVPPVTEELLAEAVRRILAVGSPEKIVLFGSHARGDARPDSDLDLLIVEPSECPSLRAPGAIFARSRWSIPLQGRGRVDSQRNQRVAAGPERVHHDSPQGRTNVVRKIGSITPAAGC
jgi:hypothetical protein